MKPLYELRCYYSLIFPHRERTSPTLLLCYFSIPPRVLNGNHLLVILPASMQGNPYTTLRYHIHLGDSRSRSSQDYKRFTVVEKSNESNIYCLLRSYTSQVLNLDSVPNLSNKKCNILAVVDSKSYIARHRSGKVANAKLSKKSETITQCIRYSVPVDSPRIHATSQY